MKLAMDGYVAALRAGDASLSQCLRFFQNSFRYDGDDAAELMRTAVLKLAAADPYLLVTDPHGQSIPGLAADDVEACIRSWQLDDASLQAFLEGQLWMAAASRRQPDLAMVQRAVAALDRVGAPLAGDREFLEVYVEALRALGDPRYAATFDELLARTDPEWHSHELSRAMRHAVEQADWPRYDELRTRWEGLPRNAHVCECAVNFVANIDGLRALDRGDPAAALRSLRAAVEVNGCAHLNTGAASLRLAAELLDRDLARTEVQSHLEAVAQYCETDAVAELIERARGR